MKHFGQLALSFLKIGLFNFGGGMAMLPLILKELEKHQWMDHDSFFNFFSLAQVTPGAIAMNTASYVGVSIAGIPGAILATFALAAPSIIIMVVLTGFLSRIKNNPIKEAIFTGLKAVTVALILFAGYQIAAGTFVDKESAALSFKAIGLSICCLVVIFRFKKVHPIMLIVLSAIIGVVVF